MKDTIEDAIEGYAEATHEVEDVGEYLRNIECLRKELALLRRAAEKWARESIDVYEHGGDWRCRHCEAVHYNGRGATLHAHDCDAALILGLEREGEK